MRPFRVYKVQSDGNLHFVEAVQTIDDATALVRGLGELWPREYVRLKVLASGGQTLVSARFHLDGELRIPQVTEF